MLCFTGWFNIAFSKARTNFVSYPDFRLGVAGLGLVSGSLIVGNGEILGEFCLFWVVA